MKFVVDAQLPRRIAYILRDHGHDAVHTLDLPDANRTSDSAILDLADLEERVVITKDSFHLARRPGTLLLISTGNITNTELAGLLLPNLDGIVAALSTADFVELTRTSLITHS